MKNSCYLSERILPFSIAALLFSGVVGGVFAEDRPTYKEIPYYLNKLNSTQFEDERVKFTKIIHDAVVGADLSSRKIVKEMEPLIDRLNGAMAADLDRKNIAGQEGWLSSAVDFFNREKLVAEVDISTAQRLPPQTEARNGSVITSFPDRIMFFQGRTPEVLIESTNIHEAVMSPEGDKVAYFRVAKAGEPTAEIWVVRTATKKGRKIAVVPSCHTILFSLNGKKLYFQEAPSDGERESSLYSISVNGRRKKKLGKCSLLDTLVASGRHRGRLIVYKSRLSALGAGYQDCAFLLNPDGKIVGRLKGPVCR